MCRLMAYVGHPQLLADIVLWPDRSIIKQSYDARERKQDPTLPFHLGHGNLNGDGFGIGWFSPDDRREQDPSPCVFTSITPAWNNENLSRLSCKIVSPLVFAHVRAAYPGMPVSEQNCHPFQWGRYMWMHNGVVGGFALIRRSLLETLKDCAYNAIQSFHSDSAVSFALFLNQLPDLQAQQPPEVLIKAIQETIATISAVQRRHGITATSLLNYVVSDGTTLIATRFVSPENEGPASLYYAEGASFARVAAQQPQQHHNGQHHHHGQHHHGQANGQPPAHPAAPAQGAGGHHASAAAAAATHASAAAPAGNGVQHGAGAPAAGVPLPAGAAGVAGAAGATAPVAGNGCPQTCTAAKSAPGSSITQEGSYDLGFSAQGPRVVFVASEPITASTSDWVAVPKNTALVVTREKGGFLNILRCPLSAQPLPAPTPPPPAADLSPPSLFHVPSTGSIAAAAGVGAPAPAAAAGAWPRKAPSGGGFGRDSLGEGNGSAALASRFSAASQSALHGFVADPQTEVSLCLEALSRGRTAKSRAFMLRLPTQQRLQGQQQAGSMATGDPEASVMASRLTSYSGVIPVQSDLSLPNVGSASHLPDWPTSRAPSLGADAADAEDSHEYMRLVGHSSPVIAMTICPRTNRLYTSGVDLTVKVWNLADNSCMRTLLGQRKPVTQLLLRAGGRLLLASSGRKIRIWDTTCFKCLHVIKIADSCGTVRCLQVMPELGAGHGHLNGGIPPAEGNGVPSLECRSTGGASSSLGTSPSQLHDTMDSIFGGRMSQRSSMGGAPAAAAAINGSGSFRAVCANGGAAAHGGVFSGSDARHTRLFVGCQDTTVKVFPLDEERLLAAACAAAAEVDTTAPGPTQPQHQVITSTDDQDPTIADQLPDQVTSAIGGHVGPVNALATSGEYLCSGGGDATVRVWEAASMRLAAVLRGHRGSVLCLLAVPGSGLLLSGARDNTIRIWDLEMDMMCRRTLVGHKDDVTGLAALTPPWAQRGGSATGHTTPGGMSPGGRGGVLAATVIASSSADGTVRLWSTTWACLCILSLPAANTPAAAPAAPPGGVPAALCACLSLRLALAGFADGEVRLWHVEDVQAAVLHHCLAASDPSFMAAAGEVLEAACGCVIGQQHVQALVQGQGISRRPTMERGAIDAAAGEAALAAPAAAQPPPAAVAVDEVLQMLGGAASGGGPWPPREEGASGSVASAFVAPEAAAAAAAAAAATPPATSGAAAEAPTVGAGSSGGAPKSPSLFESPSLMHLARPALRAGAAAAAAAASDAAAMSNSSSHNSLDVWASPTAAQQLLHQQQQGAFVAASNADAVDLSPGKASGPLSASLAAAEAGSPARLTAALGPSPSRTSPFLPATGPLDGLPATASGDKEEEAGGPQEHGRAAGGDAPAVYWSTMDGSAAAQRLPDAAAATTAAPAAPAGAGAGGLKLYGGGGTAAVAAPGCLPDGSCCPPEAAAAKPVVVMRRTPSTALPSMDSSSGHVPVHVHGRRSPLAAPGLGAAAAAGVRPNVFTPFGSVFSPPTLLSMRQAMAAAAAGPGAGAGVWGLDACSASDQLLEQSLREFIRIKTVSVNPKHRDDCLKGARFVARQLEGLGADVKVVQVLEDKNPVVIGRLGHAPDRPTVTFYGHYDVQPALEPDWLTNPFELNSVNEYLYGRGVSDNKGPILAFIYAVRELMNGCGCAGGCAGSEGGAPPAGGFSSGRLPVNIAFIFEGEEENGSKGFRQAIMQNLRYFEGTQLIVISNTQWVGENVPCLTYGMRGMLSLSVQITGPERDVHSGNDGGVFSEPMVDLVRVVGSLMGPGGVVQVPGFYDDVEAGLVELAWSSLEHSEEFSLEGYKYALGVPQLIAPPNKRDLMSMRWCRPSLSVVDMRPGNSTLQRTAAQLTAAAAATAGHGGSQLSDLQACYRFGPTRFSVIPKAAEGKISVRFVPNQDADQMVSCLRQHVHRAFEALGSANHIDLHVEARGNWWEARPGSPWLAMAEAAILKEWGVEPLYVREGGTMPVASQLEKMLCAPAIMIPMGQSSDNCHLANERIRRTNLFRGKNVIRRLLEEIAVAAGTMQQPQQLPQQPVAAGAPANGVDAFASGV